jgi:hypothetical protein
MQDQTNLRAFSHSKYLERVEEGTGAIEALDECL